jgi:hypothetical protein
MAIKSGTEAALEFIEKSSTKIGELRTSAAVQEHAEKEGYQITAQDLDNGLKAFVDKSVGERIPKWVRDRLKVTMHD